MGPLDFLVARPDPLAEIEAEHLGHLDRDHPEFLRLLAELLPAGSLAAGDVLRPLGLDRFGFRLRIERPGDTRTSGCRSAARWDAPESSVPRWAASPVRHAPGPPAGPEPRSATSVTPDMSISLRVRVHLWCSGLRPGGRC
ncbi:hypothetical protein [Blastococcus brunescens]|uniref:DUF2470 domain-containing protein n=1 Tax=Blastococcus brunescens TaxID=1564165 RepID=A0ABZ1B6P2_9ACTN|nr:hypothetical protein [Blastococcus sp. BMG 8361]WRL66478.1 hypothetical protein U6N30_14290 [Blastococcus sp. BMG 8361]